MPHALAVRHLAIDDGERVAYLARLAERRASATACGVRFWAFEHQSAAGRFVEFVETSDAASLDTALVQDTLFTESLDFRLAPAADEAVARFERYLELSPSL